MLSCKNAARLASECQDRKLSFAEQTAFRFHLMICRVCRAYARQARFIGHALETLACNTKLKLPEQARQRLKKTLDMPDNRHD